MHNYKKAPAKIEAKRPRFKRNGENYTDRSNTFARTKGSYKPIMLQQPKLVDASSSSSSSFYAADDQARQRAYRKQLEEARKPSRPERPAS